MINIFQFPGGDFDVVQTRRNINYSVVFVFAVLFNSFSSNAMFSS
jgi:hypothetical protein